MHRSAESDPIRGYRLIVITNQPGMAMGYYDVDDLKNVEKQCGK